MAGRRVNTMDELMDELIDVLSRMKRTPDADLPWIISMETQVIQKDQQQYGASSQAEQMGGGAPGNAQPAPMSDGAMAGMMSTGAGGMGMPMQGTNTGSGVGTRGMQVGPPAPSPDEIRRLLNPGPQGG